MGHNDYISRNKKKAFKMIRENMAFFGHDLSDLTDEQIEEGIIKTCELMRQSALTVDDFQHGMLIFKRAMEYGR